MRLILLRHAESNSSHSGLSDFDRPLNDQGRKNVPLMGQRLDRYGLTIDQVLSSPSKRTAQTARYICKEIGFEYNTIEFDNSLYNGSTENLLDCIQEVDVEHQCILIIVHNPSITNLSNQLQKDMYIANIPPCGMVSISFSVDAWLSIGEGTGALDFYDYPKKDI